MSDMEWGYLTSGTIEKQQNTNRTSNQMKGKFKKFLLSEHSEHFDMTNAHLICSSIINEQFYTGILITEVDRMEENTKVFLGAFEENKQNTPRYWRYMTGTKFKEWVKEGEKISKTEGEKISKNKDETRYLITIKEAALNVGNGWTEVGAQ